MKVYLVEFGCYDEAHIVGIYSSLEKAMAAHPLRDPQKESERSGGWQQSRDTKGQLEEEWTNGLDWTDAGRITAYEIDAE